MNGPIEAGLRAQLGSLPTAVTRPGETELAYALARLLDDRLAVDQHALAAQQLIGIIDRLRGITDRLRGDLDKRIARGAFFRSVRDRTPRFSFRDFQPFDVKGES